MSIAIIVHGGAGSIASARHERARTGCSAAVLLGWQILQEQGSALDAVEAAVTALENNPDFNAGTGSCLTRNGSIEMDAGIMEGHTLQIGAVAGVERIKNPIVLARKVLDSPHTLLIGQGAQHFALEQQMQLCAREELLTERQLTNWRKAQGAQFVQAAGQDEESEKKHGTVGAVALDSYSHLAAATSTGGIMNKYPGRVGDSPLIGCGFYADEYATISCTGYGEDFTRLLIARRAAEFISHGAAAQDAAERAIAFLSAHTTQTGGLILLDSGGKIGQAKNSEHMVYAAISTGMDKPLTGV